MSRDVPPNAQWQSRPDTLDANNDYQAVHTSLGLHESPATHSTYRKEAERMILWAIVERGRALSSLTTAP